MSRIETKCAGTGANAAGLTYDQIIRDPRLMERFVRDAHHARSAAIAAMFAAAARALRAGVLRGARQVYAAFAHTHPPARHC